MLLIDRRSFVAGAAAALALAAAPFGFVPAARAQESVDVAELDAAGPLPDKVLGPENAPVTVVEYASMTCPHCASFHKNTWKAFREQYVDTGKVRFVFREFPLDAAAFGVAMLARCAPAERFFDVVDAYFMQQQSWAASADPYNAIFDIAKQFGFSKESFDACLSNQALFEQVSAVRERAAEKFKVNSTPTFFINGKKRNGALSLEELAKEVDSLL